MIRKLFLLAACAALPAVAAAQQPATPPAKADSARPAMSHDMHGMHHGAMAGGATAPGQMDHAAMGHAQGHDMANCPMHQAHMQMMAFYKAIMADSVIHARIRDTRALRDQHHALDSLMAKMPAHAAMGGSAAAGMMECPMMKPAKPTG